MFNLAALLLAGSGSKASASWSFTASVSDDTELSTGIPVNLYDQDVTMTVDWGDGSTSALTSDDYSALSDMEASIHTYSEAGEYTVTLTSGDWSDFYFDIIATVAETDDGDWDVEVATASVSVPEIDVTEAPEVVDPTDGEDDEGDSGDENIEGSRYYALYYFRDTLVSINSALPEVAGVRVTSSSTATTATMYAGFCYLFYGCAQLTSLPEDLFDSCADATNLECCFYDSFYFDGSIRIKAEGVTDATNFMTSSSAYARYVYVPAGSTTADTFNALSISGMTVVEE